jgi:hypothetical protein
VNALGEFVNMEKIGHRYVIQYFHLKGLSPTNIKAELDSAVGESAPSFTTVKYWLAEFKRGRTSCQDVYIYVKFLTLLGAPYIYDISRLRVTNQIFVNIISQLCEHLIGEY